MIQTKLRVTLTSELLTTINNLANATTPEQVTEIANTIVNDHFPEIQRVIAPALFKVGIGATKPAYITKELTLEQKVNRGIATPEEEAEYEKQLMESI